MSIRQHADIAATIQQLYKPEDHRDALLSLVAKDQVQPEDVRAIAECLGIEAFVPEKPKADCGTVDYGACGQSAGHEQKTLGTGTVFGTLCEQKRPSKPQAPKPAAAIGSTSDSRQATGSLATPLHYPKKGLIYAWAVPGSTVRVYNPAIRENGEPKLIAETTAPKEFSDEVRNIAPSYPAADDFNARLAKFNAAKANGLTAVPVELPECSDDWDAGDVLFVTQETAHRTESEPATVTLVNYSAPRVRGREGFADFHKMGVDGQSLNIPAASLPPGTAVGFDWKGFELTTRATADDFGAAQVELPDLEPLTTVMAYREQRYFGAVCEAGVQARENFDSPHTKLHGLQRALRDGLLRCPTGGELDVTLTDLPDGYTLKIGNPAQSAEIQSFTSVGGKLEIRLCGIAPGDTLAVSQDLSQVDPAFARHTDYQDKTETLVLTPSIAPPRQIAHLLLGGEFIVPDASQQARIDAVLQATCDLDPAQQALALRLFGPYSKHEDLRCTPQSMIRDMMQGVLTSSVLRRFSIDKKSLEKIRDAAPSIFLEGFDAGYRVGGAQLATFAEVGLERLESGKLSKVITGGANPFGGRGTPLRPETVRSHDTLELTLPNGQAVKFRSGGYGPSGTINPNALFVGS